MKSVNENLQRQMDQAVKQGMNEGWTNDQFNDALSEIVKRERVTLRSGERMLNKNHR